MQFKVKSCVHSLTKRCFSISLSLAFSTLSHLPLPCSGSCSEVLSLKLLLTWFWKVLLSLHILGQLRSLQMYIFVSMGKGRSCAHLNFTPWAIYHKAIGKMQVPRISWVQGAKYCSSASQPELRARGRFLGKMNPQCKHVLNSKGCLAIWCGPYTWKENETLTEVRDWPEYVCKDPAKLHERGRNLHHKKQIYFMKILVDPGTDKSR